MSLEQMRKLLTAKNPELATLAIKPRADTSIYPHWEMALNATATIRFLPDGNTDNPFFWVERDMIKLPFQGVKDKPEIKHVLVQVPCMEMYDEECPVLNEIRAWMKDPTLEDMARRYWKKRSYFYQGFVRESPFRESDEPINPIRQFIISPLAFPQISRQIMMSKLKWRNANATDEICPRVQRRGSQASHR